VSTKVIESIKVSDNDKSLHRHYRSSGKDEFSDDCKKTRRDGEHVTWSNSSFQIQGAAVTDKAWSSTVDGRSVMKNDNAERRRPRASRSTSK